MITNIKCVIEACKALGLSYIHSESAENLIQVIKNGKRYLFINCATPFNRQDIARLCQDKDFTYKLLSSYVRMPQTLSFFDPCADRQFAEYIREVSIDDIVKNTIETFGFDVVIKMNSGSRRHNVFFPKTREEIYASYSKIFDKNSRYYDYVALAQERINIAQELRVITLGSEVQIVYTKKNSQKIDNTDLIQRLELFLYPVFKTIDIVYGGFDIAIDNEGNFVLIEINSAPGFEHYVKRNGPEDIVRLYMRALSSF